MTQKPTDQLLESLSAMADGEASELELRRILKSIDDGESTLEYWHRYQLVGAAIRKEANIDCSVNLLESITARIESEDSGVVALPANEVSHSYGSNRQTGLSVQTIQTRWKTFVGQGMVAASVAAVFVLGFGYLGETEVNGSSGPQLVNSPQAENNHAVADSVPIGFDLPLPEARVVSGGNAAVLQAKQNQRQISRRYSDDLSDFATQQMLDQLLIEHARRSSVNGSLGIMPFARVSNMVE